jgi:hypothetical protein
MKSINGMGIKKPLENFKMSPVYKFFSTLKKRGHNSPKMEKIIIRYATVTLYLSPL